MNDVYVGPPNAGNCLTCDRPVFRQRQFWYDRDGWTGSDAPGPGWHSHKPKFPPRPVELAVRQKEASVSITGR